MKFIILRFLLLACIPLLSGCDRLFNRKPGYIAAGKLVCGTRVQSLPTRADDGIPTKLYDAMFFGTQIEILESGEMRRRAIERVRSLHPELREIDVEIKVAQSKGSAVLNVTALGEEPKYTRVFLDALLDEYIAFGKEIVEKATEAPLRKATADVLEKEKAYREAIVKLEGARQNHAAPEAIADLQVASDTARIAFESAKAGLAKAETNASATQDEVSIMERPGAAVLNR